MDKGSLCLLSKTFPVVCSALFHASLILVGVCKAFPSPTFCHPKAIFMARRRAEAEAQPAGELVRVTIVESNSQTQEERPLIRVAACLRYVRLTAQDIARARAEQEQRRERGARNKLAASCGNCSNVLRPLPSESDGRTRMDVARTQSSEALQVGNTCT